MLKARQKFGKYVIEGKLAEGGFAVVYRARDTIEGIRVALKIPYAHLMSEEALAAFRHEVRIAAQLQHPHILPLKYADFINDRFVIITALGESSLEERMQRRMSPEKGIDFARQMLSAVAYAHEHRIIHCDIKPDNFILFPGDCLRLADFGIARVAQKTLQGSGAGTVGYIAPEQAMGKPSLRSDVFSLGIVLYRLFSGLLPEWPYDWPPPGIIRVRKRFHPQLEALMRRAMEVNAKKRYADARQMLASFQRIKDPTKPVRKTTRRSATSKTSVATNRKWKAVQIREFQQQFGRILEAKHGCHHCGGPVSECMQACPWCGKDIGKHRGEVRFSLHCPRCYRGVKSDWRYCPWCYGPGFEPATSRKLPDHRYSAKCTNASCGRRDLMPFMRYCPWCRRRIRRKWSIPSSPDKCAKCGWGVLKDFWGFCPWCSERITK
ncbi:MAG: protein kinase [Planctomycetales bacterium]|nr:protein kinase [Planctomycetales bacterium]